MNYKTVKEELIVTILRKFAIPLSLNIKPTLALELALESREVKDAEALGVIREGAVKKALKSLDRGGEWSDALTELGVFSEYDIQIIEMSVKSGNLESIIDKLVAFYAVTYDV
jgi:type II secretory pathway component PulF